MGVLQGLIISIMVAILFYRSALGLLAGLIIIPFWMLKYRTEQDEKNRIQLNKEFKEYMLLVSSSLQAGYSVERSLSEAEKEHNSLFTEKSLMKETIHKMNTKISVNVPLEKAFEEFAEELAIDDAVSLAEIISFAKRGGGDYGKHIRNTAVKIEEKLACQQEIDTMTSEKQLEFKIMSCMPLGILAYISITSGDFVAPLYGNPMGIGIMSACLLVYGVLIVIGGKLVNIKM